MFDLIRARLRDGERGFTLIELLVVMIIIAILMAVAVPVFLGQKQKALATNAKTNVKNVYDTIEACAASTTNGSLVDNGFDCRSATEVAEAEPSLTSLVTGTNCGGVTCVAITSGGALQSNYTLVGVTVSGDATNRARFRLIRTDTLVTKDCGAAVGDARQIAKKVCPTGRW